MTADVHDMTADPTKLERPPRTDRAGAETPGADRAGAASGFTDEALVERLSDGDASAGEELVKRHQEALVRYLFRLTGNRHIAEELHQTTWLSVLENVERFVAGTTPGGFRAWLFRIATNKATDHWRSRGRESAARQALTLVSDQEVGPDEVSRRMEASEQDERLAIAIAQLPEGQRQVLLLRYYSGLKFTQIAALLGCPLNTALGRMHKAVLKLRQLMEEPKGRQVSSSSSPPPPPPHLARSSGE